MNSFKHEDLHILVLDDKEIKIMEALALIVSTSQSKQEVADYIHGLAIHMMTHNVKPAYQCQYSDSVEPVRYARVRIDDL